MRGMAHCQYGSSTLWVQRVRTVDEGLMMTKPLSNNENGGVQSATDPSPANFPLGSPQSRAAARLRLQRIALAGKRLPHCICFPETEHPSFGFRVESEIAARVKCPIHGDRSGTWCFLYAAKWLRERQEIRRKRLSPQFQKAWLASFPPDLWPADEEETADGIYLRLKDGTRLVGEEFSWRKKRNLVAQGEVCQFFCVNDQVLFFGMGARGKGQHPFPRPAILEKVCGS